MISPSHLRNHIIAPTLEMLDTVHPGLDSLAAQNLILGTAAKESELGLALVQYGNGPAVSIYQIEPPTVDTIMGWIEKHPDIKSVVATLTIRGMDLVEQLKGNLYLATALCRIRYFMDPAPLPDADDIPGLARYYKRVWNTMLGRATVDEFISCWERLVGPA